jgi:aryl-alcohol dehydrogenase-like predicted oxidoreductase
MRSSELLGKRRAADALKSAPLARRRITTAGGDLASVLGLAAYPNQDPRCVRQAFHGGINYFFFYGPGYQPFIRQLALVLRKHRDKVIVATGSGARKSRSLDAVRRKILAALATPSIDVFFAEYIHSGDDPEVIFGSGGLFDELTQWKREGWIRYVGATTHDRRLARRLAEEPRVDVLMHRFNMAHRKAVKEVFPAAMQSRTPVVAFTATRWGTLLKGQAEWPGEPPSAADCYRYCLTHPAVQVVLAAPRTVRELQENLRVLKSPKMNERDRSRWERFGDLVVGAGADAFETRWP